MHSIIVLDKLSAKRLTMQGGFFCLYLRMPKQCQHNECTYNVFGGGYCRIHQYLRTDKKKPKKIKPVSDKLAENLKQYKIVRAKYLESHPICQANVPKICTKHSTQIHHRAGRLGEKLIDTKNFLAVCHHCHCYIEVNVTEAKEKGWSIDRF